MSVNAEVRPLKFTSTGGKAVPDAGASDGLLHGRVRLAGLHPKLIPAIPAPQKFEESPHYPLILTNSPFVANQVRSTAVEVARALRKLLVGG